VAPLFWLFVALHVIPAWLWPHFPAQDGPGHVLHSCMLLHLDDVPAWREHFVRNLQPMPNWIAYALLCGFLQFLGPAAAEKALVSTYVVALAWCTRRCARSFEPRCEWSTFLVFPLVYSFALHIGLYNFALGVPLALLAFGEFWRARRSLRPLQVAWVLALLVATWFAHFVAFVIAASGIAVLALATGPGATLRWGLALAPALALPAWFLTRQPPLATVGPPEVGVSEAARHFAAVVSSEEQKPLAVCVLALWGAWAVASVVARLRARPVFQEKDALLAVVALFVAATLFAPNETSSGGILKPRLGLMPFLLLIGWFEPLSGATGWLRGARRALCAATLALAAVHLATTVRYQAVASDDLEEYLAAEAEVAPGSRIMPLVWPGPFARAPAERFAIGMRIPNPIAHAADWLGTDRHCANLMNFHAQNENFPILFRHAGTYAERLVRALATADYVLMWGMPAERPAEVPHFEHFRETFRSVSGRLRVFRRE
jgi:hypothetical protein